MAKQGDYLNVDGKIQNTGSEDLCGMMLLLCDPSGYVVGMQYSQKEGNLASGATMTHYKKFKIPDNYPHAAIFAVCNGYHDE